jgi:hypothetical protein
MKARFNELLPWYANGTLGEADCAWVDQYLAEHPEARAELDWYHSLAARLQESAPVVPETIGLARAMRLINGDQPSFAERVSAFLASFGMRPAAAFAALAILAMQGGVIINLMHSAGDDASEIRALHAQVTDEGPILKINFAPDALEAQIRHLLMTVQGRLVGGPGQLGDYYVVVSKGKEEQIARQLRSDPIVIAVTVAPGLPPRE